MKKISLKDVKNGLKRDEMRAIMGGSGGLNWCTLWCASTPNSMGYCEYLSSGSAGPGWYCRVG